MEVYSHRGKFDYTVVRSNRKTLAIAIKPDGSVWLKVPRFIDLTEIETILERKTDWILTNQIKMKEITAQKKELNFVTGEEILFQGNPYTIKMEQIVTADPGERSSSLVIKKGRELVVFGEALPREERKQLISDWMIEQAKFAVKEKIEFYADKLSVHPAKVTLRDTKTRWGSCSSKRNIMINWKLVMAPSEVLDYVIVHELCHLKEMNHSKNFWNEVESVIPDYKEKRNWLKEHGSALNF